MCAGRSVPAGVFRRVCSDRCVPVGVLAGVFRNLCSGRCVPAGVFWQVCAGRWAPAGVFRQVCSSRCADRRAAAGVFWQVFQQVCLLFRWFVGSWVCVESTGQDRRTQVQDTRRKTQVRVVITLHIAHGTQDTGCETNEQLT